MTNSEQTLDQQQAIAAVVDTVLPSTGERFIPGLGGTIELEHLHRYLFAKQACHGKVVLDIACGEGYGSSMLAQAARSVIGVDIAPDAVLHARKHYSRSNLGFEVGDCAAMPVADASIDVVVSFETIEHHDQHEEMMREIRRVLKPGGTLILSSPERFEYSERPGTPNEFHVHELYRDEFVTLVGRYFPNVEIYDQKVVFGSAILSEGLSSRAVSAHADSPYEAAHGLVRPVYLIAVASDAALPTFDTGVFEQRLAESSEWKWWGDTVEQRDLRIRQLDAHVRELETHLDRAKTESAQSAELYPVIASLTEQRDRAVLSHREAIEEIVDLQRRLIEADHALGTQREVLEQGFMARLADQHRLLELREKELTVEARERERALQAGSAAREAEWRLASTTREETSKAEFAVQQDALRASFAAREEALKEEMAAAERQSAIDRTVERDRLRLEAARREQTLKRAHHEERLALEKRLSVERDALTVLRQRLAVASGELARQAIDRAEAQDRIARLEAAHAWLSKQLDDATAHIAHLDAELGPLHHYAAKLQWVLSTTQHALEMERARCATHERSLAEAEALEASIRRSRSWQVTAPLRAVTDTARSARRAARALVAVGGRSIQRTYRQLPGDGPLKAGAKNAFFGLFGFAIRDTALYRDWSRYRELRSSAASVEAGPTDEAAEQVEAPFLGVDAGLAVTSADGDAHGSADGPTAIEPTSIPQLDEDVTVMTEPVTLEPTYSAASAPLWVADGEREWSDLPVLRERIAASREAQRQSLVTPAVPLVDLSGSDLELVADTLDFSACDDPRVTILVPAYNHIELTLECLTAIERAKGNAPFEIIVADDASTDRSASLLARVRNIRVHTNETNLHFLRNCNAALPMARGDYVVFMNNDVQVQDWWLDELLLAFESHENVGAVGPKILYPSGHLQEAGCAFNTDMTVDMIGLDDDPLLPRYNYARRVDYCSGACLMVATPVLKELGGFCEDFAPAYCEDGDLCLRIRNRGLFVYYAPASTVVHRLSATTAAESLDAKRRLVADNLVTFAGKWQQRVEEEAAVRTIAFYLPQFYPFAENDRWWGKGFTEWTNVTKAQPNFVGHYQPHLPADLGYYDLRMAESMKAQAALAQRYGLGGFCFYYYWFAGKRLLDVPIEAMLESGEPAFPFCLCWANENWTRRWDGQESQVLMAQSHSDADDEAVIKDLMRYFRSPNYIRIDGRPLLVVYRVTLFPDFARTAAHWREVCRAEGFGEIYLAMVESFELVAADMHPSKFGCDATIEFPPQGLAEAIPPSGPLLNPDFVGTSVDYRELAVRYCTRPHPRYTRFRGAMPGWDNTPRRQHNSYCIEHATPGGFQAWLEHIVDDARRQHFGDERIVFINAWNEWAEGAHLEPDRRFGHTYLEALRNAHDHRSLIRRHRYVL